MPDIHGPTYACVLNATILRHIFDLSLDKPIVLPLPSTDPRYPLILVCKTWEAVITATPQYWNRYILNPLLLKSPTNQLSIYNTYIRRSRSAGLSINFSPDIIDETWDEGRAAALALLPVSTSRAGKGKPTHQLLYGHGNIEIVGSMISPHVQNIKQLRCTVLDFESHQALSDIGSAAFACLEFMDITFIRTSQSEGRRSDLESGYHFHFKAFSHSPNLSVARIHIMNNIHPLDLNLPWQQLTKLDFLDTVMPAVTVLRILSRCSVSLFEAYFTAELNALIKIHFDVPAVVMSSLERFRLRIVHPRYHQQLESVFIFPSLKYIWIEKVIRDLLHDWDMGHYTAVLSVCSTSLLQLIFSNLCITPKHPRKSAKSLHSRQTSYSELEELFSILPNLQDLRFPSGIHIHPPTFEKIANGDLLPHLHSIELATIHPHCLFDLARKRNGFEPSTSAFSLRFAAIVSLHLNLPIFPIAKQEEITRDGKELGISRADGLVLKFIAPCMCRYCFGN